MGETMNEPTIKPSHRFLARCTNQTDKLTCAGAGSDVVCHLDKEGSLQCLSQVIITAEQSKLLRGGQLPSQHVGFLELLQLLPEPTHSKGGYHTRMRFLF